VSSPSGDALEVKLYVKPGCHLCEEAETEIAAIGALYPHTLECMDITADAGLTRRYWDQIPVLVIDQREYPAPLSRAVIERALSDAAARAGISRSTPGIGLKHAASPASGTRPGGDEISARQNPWSSWLGH
jgi:hypothetical protein